MKVTSQLKSLMQERGITSEELSEATGISVNQIHHLAASSAEYLNLNHISKICDYFELKTLDELLNLREDGKS